MTRTVVNQKNQKDTAATEQPTQPTSDFHTDIGQYLVPTRFRETCFGIQLTKLLKDRHYYNYDGAPALSTYPGGRQFTYISTDSKRSYRFVYWKPVTGKHADVPRVYVFAKNNKEESSDAPTAPNPLENRDLSEGSFGQTEKSVAVIELDANERLTVKENDKYIIKTFKNRNDSSQMKHAWDELNINLQLDEHHATAVTAKPWLFPVMPSQPAIIMRNAGTNVYSKYREQNIDSLGQGCQHRVRGILKDLQKKHLFLLHRDVKPENIVEKEIEGGLPQISLIDMGLSQSLRVNSIFSRRGTPLFWGKEMYHSQCGSHPNQDIYSLAIVLFLVLNMKTYSQKMQALYEREPSGEPSPQQSSKQEQLEDPSKKELVNKKRQKRRDFAHLAEYWKKSFSLQGAASASSTSYATPIISDSKDDEKERQVHAILECMLDDQPAKRPNIHWVINQFDQLFAEWNGGSAEFDDTPTLLGQARSLFADGTAYHHVANAADAIFAICERDATDNPALKLDQIYIRKQIDRILKTSEIDYAKVLIQQLILPRLQAELAYEVTLINTLGINVNNAKAMTTNYQDSIERELQAGRLNHLSDDHIIRINKVLNTAYSEFEAAFPVCCDLYVDVRKHHFVNEAKLKKANTVEELSALVTSYQREIKYAKTGREILEKTVDGSLTKLHGSVRTQGGTTSFPEFPASIAEPSNQIRLTNETVENYMKEFGDRRHTVKKIAALVQLVWPTAISCALAGAAGASVLGGPLGTVGGFVVGGAIGLVVGLVSARVCYGFWKPALANTVVDTAESLVSIPTIPGVA